MEAGQADIVGYCRSLLANPQLFVKGTWDKEDTGPSCLRCMDGCGRIFFGLPDCCAVNPGLGCKTEARLLHPAKVSNKVMVIGFGSAGVEAARVLVSRGHVVTLLRSGKRNGGYLYDASMVSFKHLCAITVIGTFV